jgi:hypothetical protein
MLHINKKNENTHKKAFAVEVFMGFMLLSIFSTSLVQASDITANMVIKLTNEARKSANVMALVKNDLLQKAAERKAQDMIDNDYFAHVSPQGKTPWNWIQDAGYDYQYAGENLAINFTNAEDEQKAWMESPLHKKNILNPDYEEIGVAVREGIIDGNKTIVTVQEFGKKMPKVAKAINTPEDAKPKVTVAGIAVSTPMQVEGLQKKSATLDLKAFYQANKPTIIVWYGALALALLVIVIDVAAIFHKKHEQIFILHDVRNKHV